MQIHRIDPINREKADWEKSNNKRVSICISKGQQREKRENGTEKVSHETMAKVSPSLDNDKPINSRS